MLTTQSVIQGLRDLSVLVNLPTLNYNEFLLTIYSNILAMLKDIAMQSCISLPSNDTLDIVLLRDLLIEEHPELLNCVTGINQLNFKAHFITNEHKQISYSEICSFMDCLNQVCSWYISDCDFNNLKECCMFYFDIGAINCVLSTDNNFERGHLGSILGITSISYPIKHKEVSK